MILINSLYKTSMLALCFSQNYEQLTVTLKQLRRICMKTIPKLLMLPNEKLIIGKHKHWFVIASPLMITALLEILLIFFATFSLSYTPVYFSVALLSLLTLTAILVSRIAKVIIDWYYHLYILTDRRILELSYCPLSSHVRNEVLLDQVRCTEVDVQTNGLLNELLDKGDVVITFDRPTHQEEFSIANIYQPIRLAALLENQLLKTASRQEETSMWYKDRKNPKRIQFIPQLYPDIRFGPS